MIRQIRIVFVSFISPLLLRSILMFRSRNGKFGHLKAQLSGCVSFIDVCVSVYAQVVRQIFLSSCSVPLYSQMGNAFFEDCFQISNYFAVWVECRHYLRDMKCKPDECFDRDWSQCKVPAFYLSEVQLSILLLCWSMSSMSMSHMSYVSWRSE